ncbi:unnamed protein product [Effrenium voratum]|nr:unnamed protein product [Effrenium voratum]
MPSKVAAHWQATLSDSATEIAADALGGCCLVRRRRKGAPSSGAPLCKVRRTTKVPVFLTHIHFYVCRIEAMPRRSILKNSRRENSSEAQIAAERVCRDHGKPANFSFLL